MLFLTSSVVIFLRISKKVKVVKQGTESRSVEIQSKTLWKNITWAKPHVITGAKRFDPCEIHMFKNTCEVCEEHVISHVDSKHFHGSKLKAVEVHM